MNTLQPIKEPSARDRITRLLWLQTAVGFVVLPHLTHVSIWISALLIGVFVWRYLAETRNWSMPSAWIKAPLVFAGLTAVAMTYRKITGVEAGTALLLVMLALKILETRSSRDLTVVSLICWFLMFAVFLREQQLWAIPYIFGGITLSVAALLQIRRTNELLPVTAVARQTGVLLLQAMPIILLLFFLFPRIPAPFWAMSTGGSSAQTGLSDTVNPGDISSLSQSDSVAFRVRFKGAVPPPEQRYWRGPVMSYFNGRAWSWADRGEPIEADGDLLLGDEFYDYEMMLEPHGRSWLLALETPAQWSQTRSYLSANRQLISRSKIRQRIAYTARSYPNSALSRGENERHLQAMRFLPPEQNPKLRQFARSLRAQSDSESDYLERLLRNFREQPFYYTLQPALLGDDPLDQFLFDTREGFCEHYASAFAALARAADIPARVVTGYLGGEINPLSGDLVVRQSDAHAWTEIWLSGQWVRIDPTAAVAPERIELGLSGALSAEDLSFGRNVRSTLLVSQALLSIDAVNAAWDRWVLAFGPETQSMLLRKAGFSAPDMRDLVIVMAIGVTLLLAALAYYLRISARPAPDPLQQAYARFCRKLAAQGFVRAPGETPADFAARATAGNNPDSDTILRITALYSGLRYAPVANRDRGIDELTALSKRFKPGKA